MKKITKWTVILSVMFCAFGMTACGNDDANSQAPSVGESQTESVLSEVSEKVSEQVSEITEKSEIFEEISDPSQVSSVEQLFSMSAAVEEFNQISQKMSNDTQTMEILAEGDHTVVLQVTLTNAVDDPETIVSQLEELTESNQSVFANTAASLELLPNLNDIIVSVRYKNPDGTLLYQQDFTSDTATEETSMDIAVSTPGQYASLTEYIDDNYETFQQIMDVYTTDDMVMSIFVESDTKLVYQYQLMVESSDETAAQLEEALDGFEDVYISEIDAMEGIIDSDISIVVRYIDQDYNTIFEKEFTN